jgi:hypothetical protein
MWPRLPFDDPFVVTARDGTVFVCRLEVIEGEIRWVFISSDRAEYFGPVYAWEDTLEQVQTLVADWWEHKPDVWYAGYPDR